MKLRLRYGHLIGVAMLFPAVALIYPAAVATNRLLETSSDIAFLLGTGIIWLLLFEIGVLAVTPLLRRYGQLTLNHPQA